MKKKDRKKKEYYPKLHIEYHFDSEDFPWYKIR